MPNRCAGGLFTVEGLPPRTSVRGGAVLEPRFAAVLGEPASHLAVNAFLGERAKLRLKALLRRDHVLEIATDGVRSPLSSFRNVSTALWRSRPAAVSCRSAPIACGNAQRVRHRRLRGGPVTHYGECRQARLRSSFRAEAPLFVIRRGVKGMRRAFTADASSRGGRERAVLRENYWSYWRPA